MASFRFDGSTWARQDFPTLPVAGWPIVAVGPDGEPWVGSCGWFGSFDRFDGVAWAPVRPIPEVKEACITALQRAPDGSLWASVSVPRGSVSSSVIARYDGLNWTVYDAASSGERVLGQGFVIAPHGTVWLATYRGLARFDGVSWSLWYGGLAFNAVALAPDGTLWLVGPSGLMRLPEAAAPG